MEQEITNVDYTEVTDSEGIVVRENIALSKAINNSQEYNQVLSLIESKSLPAWCSTPEKAYLVMKRGKELGFKDLASFNLLTMIQGNLTLTANGIKVLLKMNGCEWEVTEDGQYLYDEQGNFVDIRTTIKMAVPSKYNSQGCTYHTLSYCWSEAETAGLTGKSVWKSYPKDMLFNRCITRLARMVVPELLQGLYTNEELGDNAIE